MKKYLSLVVFILIITGGISVSGYSLANSNNHLMCSVTDTCSEVSLLKISAYTEAHVALMSYAGTELYPYVLCCGNVEGLSTTMDVTDVLHVASLSNSHVEGAENTFFSNNITMGWHMDVDRKFTCQTVLGECQDTETAIIALQSVINSQAAESGPSSIGFGFNICCDNCDVYENDKVNEPSGVSYCFNNYDDDCDTFTDQDDTNCQVYLSGFVNDTNGNPIADAEIYAFRVNTFYQYNKESDHTTYSDANGFFNLMVYYDDIEPYHVSYKKAGYETILYDILMDQDNFKDMDPVDGLEMKSVLCYDDCTRSDSMGFCVRGCDGLEGCEYFDLTAKDLCAPYDDNEFIKNKKSGMPVWYDLQQKIICCASTASASTALYADEGRKHQLNVNSKDTYTGSKAVIKDGQMTTMHLTIFPEGKN